MASEVIDKDELTKLREFKSYVIKYLKLYKPLTQITNGIFDFHKKELMTFTCYCDEITKTNIINLKTNHGGRSGNIENSSNICVSVSNCKTNPFNGIMTCLIKINDNLDHELYYSIIKYANGKFTFVNDRLCIRTVKSMFD